MLRFHFRRFATQKMLAILSAANQMWTYSVSYLFYFFFLPYWPPVSCLHHAATTCSIITRLCSSIPPPLADGKWPRRDGRAALSAYVSGFWVKELCGRPGSMPESWQNPLLQPWWLKLWGETVKAGEL